MTNKELATRIFTTTDAIKAAAGRNNWGGEWDVNTELNEGQQTQALSYFSQHNKKRKPETTEAAAALLVELGLKEAPQQPTTAQRIKQAMPTTAKDMFLFVVLLSAMCFQMHHNAHIVAIVEKGESAFVWGWVFAFAIQFTAVLMTIEGGGKNWLRGFAVLEFAINMLYYSSWEHNATFSQWSIHIIISFGIAFAIYAYAHLFTQRHKEQHHV
jgi:hypothetical protein